MTFKRTTNQLAWKCLLIGSAMMIGNPSASFAQPPEAEEEIADGSAPPAKEADMEAAVKPADAGKAALVPEQKPEDAAKNAQPKQAVMLEPGRNLLGERIEKVAGGQLANEPSADVKRVTGMIDETIQLLQEQESLESRRLDLLKKNREKRTEFDQLPELYKATAGEIIAAQQKMGRLGGALNLGLQNPQVREYFFLKNQVKTLIAKMQLMEKQKVSLPIEIRNLFPEQKRLLAAQVTNAKKIDALVESWEKILNVSTFVPPSDAKAILQNCQQKLIQYPEVAPIRAMSGLCHVHLSQPQAGIAEFKKTLAALGSAPAKLRIICMIGISWASLDEGDADAAGAHIAEARKLSKRNFELAICEARLAELQNRNTKAVSAYRRAMAISPRNPCGFRMAAIMVAKSKVRPPNVALSLAKQACDLDEFDDFRNSIALAYAQHAAGDKEAREKAIETAYSHAGVAGREQVDLLTKDLLKDE